MWVGLLVVLWRIDPRYGTLALALPLSRIFQAQFDLFWTSVQTSIPFVVAGICLGALALHEETEKKKRGLPESLAIAPERVTAMPRRGSARPRR
jgi:hypothetical protein